MRAWKLFTDTATLPVKRFLNEDNFSSAVGARKDFTPDGVVDPPFRLRGLVRSFVHPAKAALNFLEEPLRRLLKCCEVEAKVVAGSDQGRGGRQVIQDYAPGPPFGQRATFLLPLLLQLKAIGRRRRSAPLGGHPSHPCAGKPIEDRLARPCVMKDRRNDGEMGDLCVVRMGLVQGIGLADACIYCEWLTVLPGGGLRGSASVAYVTLKERIRAGRVVRGVRPPQDVVVRPQRETSLSEGWVEEFLSELLKKEGPTRALALEGHAETLDGPILNRRQDSREFLVLRCFGHSGCPLGLSVIRPVCYSRTIRTLPGSCPLPRSAR